MYTHSGGMCELLWSQMGACVCCLTSLLYSVQSSSALLANSLLFLLLRVAVPSLIIVSYPWTPSFKIFRRRLLPLGYCVWLSLETRTWELYGTAKPCQLLRCVYQIVHVQLSTVLDGSVTGTFSAYTERQFCSEGRVNRMDFAVSPQELQNYRCLFTTSRKQYILQRLIIMMLSARIRPVRLLCVVHSRLILGLPSHLLPALWCVIICFEIVHSTE